MREVMRDGGEEATPTGRANPEAKSGDDENSKSSERASSSDESSAGESSSRATKEKEEPSSSSSRDRGRRPEDGGAEPLKDAVAGVGSLFGAMLGGVLNLGGALASEVASQHENHRRRVEKERVIRRPRESGRRRRAELEPGGRRSEGRSRPTQAGADGHTGNGVRWSETRYVG